MKTCCGVNGFSFSAKTSLITIIFLLCGLTATASYAATTTKGDYHLILNGRSIHLSAPAKGESFNENNFGTGFQYEFKRPLGSKWVNYVTGSAFNDSYNNLSYYVGGGQTRRYQLHQGMHLDVGYVAFMMARKDFDNYQPFLGVLPVASFGTRKVALNMTYIPAINQKIDELIFFQLKIATKGW
ncbi:MAG: hypothetical protein OEZ33_11515 [Gammaproteobacteria bacterium]|nr:hypothetical protein [Gammaproteobacteria bacterium]MDH5778833.1 hypothetical protein [Gammaproteobacteria bacterium]